MTRDDILTLAACAAAALGALLSGGCAAAQPASRANATDYGGVRVEVRGRNNSVTLRIGDGLMATADSNGSTETQTATPTLSVPTTVTAPAAADPLTVGIQEAGATAREGIKAAAKGAGVSPGGGAVAPRADCTGGECGTKE